ncbi:MAG: TIGR03790 family protein [Planctomycetes bacterium]|nr:TIGR03790 family protein [Planctomycetota bacterium]
MSRSVRRASFVLSALGLALAARAGGSAENVLLLVDPSNPEALQVANHYRAARGIPDGNVLYMAPTPATYTGAVAAETKAFLGALEHLGIADHVDYVVLPSGGSFFVSASGLVSDGCSSVNRFAAPTPYTLVRVESTILAGTPSSLSNGFFRNADDARAFDSSVAYGGGAPNAAGKRYFLGAMLGYTGANGNTKSEVLALIDRSVAVDGTHPVGTIYFMQTTDPARSGPRQGLFPAAVTAITNLGGQAQHLFADLPLGHQDCLGVLTGVATPDIQNGNFTLLPGAFCDHLTSYAATFEDTSQTKMSRWIARGASGTSGTVEEPCNYAGKFPTARLHVFYEQGSSLGEAWFRSLAYVPFQQLFTGDPLTRPFAHLPTVSVPPLPAVASGIIAITPSASTTHPTAQIASFELLVDGRSVATIENGLGFALDTSAFPDGDHDVRVLAYDDTPVKSVGRWIGTLETQNHGKSASMTPSSTSGDLSTRFDFTLTAAGGTLQELHLVQGARVLASTTTSGAVVSVRGSQLGADVTRVHGEAWFTDGTRAITAPIDVTVADAPGTPGSAAPVAYSFTKVLRPGVAHVLELPATFDGALSATTFSIVTPPAQSTLLGGNGAYRLIQPNVAASGTDTLVFQAANANGIASGTVTIVYQAATTTPPPANFCVGAPNSVGAGARMTALGAPNIGANDFQVGAFGLPINTSCLFLYGSVGTQLPLGNGFLCIDQPFRRMGVLQASIAGDVYRAIDFTTLPFANGPFGITAGSTWNFQVWYRNVAGGGAGFNLSDGLRVTFGL